MTLGSALNRVLDFFADLSTPRHITAQKDDAKHLAGITSLEDVALLVVDVQEQFCGYDGGRLLKEGTKKSEKIARDIGSIIPAFRAAGVPVYAIYFKNGMDTPPENVDFHHFQFDPERDTPVQKRHNSAFDYTNLDRLLKESGKKQLLVLGFNLRACVCETVIDGREKKYDVFLLRDLTGNGRDVAGDDGEALEWMAQEGTHIVQSASVLKRLKEIKIAA
jgi:nicotinamidase-related amidase